jgi:hypothetical protein
LRNDLKSFNHWLKIKLIGSQSNRSAIGARLICRYGGKRQIQEVLAQSSFYSCNDQRLHFGLGSAKAADLEIRWPSGLVQQLRSVNADQILSLKEPSQTSAHNSK